MDSNYKCNTSISPFMPNTARGDFSKGNTTNLMMTALKKTIDVKKQKMMNSFSAINIQSFIELERIKKPSQVAFITGRLVC